MAGHEDHVLIADVALAPQAAAGAAPHRAAGRLGVALSVAVHVAALAALGVLGLAPRLPDLPPPPVEITVAWTPPPADSVAEAAPAAPAPPAPPPPVVAPAPHSPVRLRAPLPPPARVPPPAAPSSPVASSPAAPSSPVASSPAAAPPPARPAPPVAASAPPPAKAEALSRYARLLLAQLEQHKTYPPQSLRRGEQGTVTLRLTVDEAGRLVGVEAVGDGPERLVDASLAAVRAAAPFPPLPEALGVSPAAFDVPITYRLP